MAKLYGNENAPLPTVLALRALGHDVLTSLEAGHANRRLADSLLLAFANGQGRIVLTNDRADFRALHRSGAAHCGIVAFTNDADFEALADRVDTALKDSRATGRFFASVTKGGHTFR